MMYMLAQAGYYKYQNLGEALLYGADAEVKWDINRNWFVSLNGTWQKSLDYSKYLFGTNTPSQYTYSIFQLDGRLPKGQPLWWSESIYPYLL